MIWLLVLWQLPYLELQPYDEGYYALRTKAILYFNCWLDQSDYAIGGFYSASHPPLYIWLAALSAKVVGMGEFAFRLPSWLAACLFLTTLVQVAKRSDLPHTPLYALVVAGFLPLVLWYARLAQLDMLLMWLSMLQVYFFQRYEQSGRLWHAAAAGLVLGGALMTKVLVGLFPALAIGLCEGYRIWTKQITCKNALRALLLFYALGLSVAMLWFAWICAQHPGYFEQYISWFVADRVQRNQMLSQHRTGVFYYLNVVLTRIPLAALSMLWFWAFWRQPHVRKPYRVRWLIWLLLTASVLSLSQTKLLWYTLLFLPPLILMAAESLSLLLNVPNEHHLVKLIALSALFLSCIWSLLQPFHRAVLEAILNQDWLVMLGIVAVLAAALAAGALVHIALRREQTRAVLLTLLILTSTCVAIWSAVNGLAFVQTYHGAKSASEFVHQSKPACLIHLVPPARIGDQRFNPQFSYYFDGIDVDTMKWGAMMRYVRLPVTAAAALRDTLAAEPSCAIVLEKTVLSSERLQLQTVNELEWTAHLLQLVKVLDTPNYAVYVPQPQSFFMRQSSQPNPVLRNGGGL
ncbi:MAG: glycosyltransferase family 39 protein [Chloroherpetonaceae bacterium]|nr:glycosyltransferase family 39 protein [Chloroherpetonaceae bacterium]